MGVVGNTISFLLSLVGLTLWLTAATSAPAETQKIVLTDVPGVNWTGGARKSDWGDKLGKDKVTIYIRHQGPGWDKWDKPKETNVEIVTLNSNEWNEQEVTQKLSPIVQKAYASGKNVHFVIDTNTTLTSHTLGRFLRIGKAISYEQIKAKENEWAAQVATFVASHNPGGYFSALVTYSNSTITTKYLKNFKLFDYTVIASPRGDDSISFIYDHAPGELPPKIDIIRGFSDLSSWRWISWLRGGIEGLVKKNPNVRIIELQDINWPGKTHSQLQETGYKGKWKVRDNTGIRTGEAFLGDFSRMPGGTELPTTFKPAGQDTGGIDFRTVELRYLSESDLGDEVAAVFRSVPEGAGNLTASKWADACQLSWDSLFTWLALPDSSFWVNLNPTEPNRIIEPELGKTDAGRILVEADFQLKKDIAKMTHPKNSKLGRKFWDRIYERAIKEAMRSGTNQMAIPVTFRVWIVPGEIQICTNENEIIVVQAFLDVKMESEYLGAQELAGFMLSGERSDTQEYAEGLLKEMILPELIKWVNTEPQYCELRQIFYSRVVADWYQSRMGGNYAFDRFTGLGQTDDWQAKKPWNRQTIFNQYLNSIRNGEYSLTETSESTVGNYRVKATRQYFTGGVDWTDIPIKEISYEEVVRIQPRLAEGISGAFELVGYSDGEAYWAGGIYPVNP